MSCEGHPIEMWPGDRSCSDWPGTRRKVMGFLADQREALSKGPFLTEGLLRWAVEIVAHLKFDWNRSWFDPLIRAEVGVMKTHFANRFAANPNLSQDLEYRRSLPKTSYGTGDLELVALNFLSSADHAMRADGEWELDPARLVSHD